MIVTPEQIIVQRLEANFDRACDYAYRLALSRFGFDDCGRTDRLDLSDFDRTTDSVCVTFVRYRQSGGMGGREHIYEFEATITRENE